MSTIAVELQIPMMLLLEVKLVHHISHSKQLNTEKQIKLVFKSGNNIHLFICGFFSHQLFVKSNQGEEETTKINYLTFIGTPVQATNMNDFRRVGTSLQNNIW